MDIPRKRCAIYTRKSSEEGLEQEFNSLDAQAESCAAYILSQAGEGWENTGQVYSDAGISGGHMERAGLQSMLADIEAGKIDVIVVYKVDRLTRSLADFAKLVDVFDTHEVSFVSVTQAFNTTNSMGRLTLNVLLSFAQFEREVTAERIRDKIAASKAKGKWMGGLPSLGYDNVDTKLVINIAEAKTIRHIFRRYLALESVGALKAELDKDDYVTKLRKTKKQMQCGGKPFSRGHLYKLLSNPVYIGMTKHKDKTYKGEHEPILDNEVWESVQSALSINAPKRKRNINIKSGSLLTGILYDASGDRLSPVSSKKPSGRRYRYYVSNRLTKGEIDDGTALRLSAKHIEAHVVRRLTKFLKEIPILLKQLQIENPSAHIVSNIVASAEAITTKLTSTAGPETARTSILDILQRIDVHTDKLVLTLRRQPLFAGADEDSTVRLEYTLQQKRRGVESKLVIGGKVLGEPDTDLIRIIAEARSWYDGLKSGEHTSINDIATYENMDKGDVSRTLPLAFLAPSIVSDIISGQHPVDMTPDSLRRKTAHLPLDWNEQRQFLGFIV